MPSPPPAGDQAADDAFNARMLATNCLAFEADRGRAEIRVASLGDRLLPRGLAHQHRYARHLFDELDGDVDRLLAAAQVCRANSRDDTRSASRRLTDLRAADLCERAAALVTEPAGADPERRAALAQHLLDGDEENTEEPRYRLMWTALLPVPEPFRASCMVPLNRGERLARQLRPQRTVRACCWYHAGDWHRANRTARRLLTNARRAGVAGDDVHDYAVAAAEVEGVSGWQLEAIDSLLCPPTGIQVDILAGTSQRFFVNGQHRAQAMIEAGVRLTITVATG